MLIVEDHPAMRKALEAFVRSHFPSHRILAAADADEALALCKAAQPTVVLMDIQLGNVSGIELTVSIKKRYAATVVIMVTNMVDPIYRDLAEKAGAFAYVIKSRLHDDLIPAIRRALALHESGRAGDSR